MLSNEAVRLILLGISSITGCGHFVMWPILKLSQTDQAEFVYSPRMPFLESYKLAIFGEIYSILTISCHIMLVALR